MNTAGPAGCTPAELLMNRTIATKITTRSNGPSVRATRTGATFSEIMAFSSGRAAMRDSSRPGGEHDLPGARAPPPAVDRPILASAGPRAQPRLSDDIGRNPCGRKGSGDVLRGDPGPSEMDAGSGRATLASVGGCDLLERAGRRRVDVPARQVAFGGLGHERVVGVADVGDRALGDLGQELV